MLSRVCDASCCLSALPQLFPSQHLLPTLTPTVSSTRTIRRCLRRLVCLKTQTTQGSGALCSFFSSTRAESTVFAPGSSTRSAGRPPQEPVYTSFRFAVKPKLGEFMYLAT